MLSVILYSILRRALWIQVHLSVISDEKVESFSSILEMLKQTKTSYQSIIHNQEAMEYLLGLGCKKLAEIRSQSPDAGK